MLDSLHTMKVVADKVGLSPHVIRVWERRYGAIRPERTDSNRRTYSDEQVERLKLLKTITEAGHRIGIVAKLSTEELRRLEGGLRDQIPQPTTSQDPAPFVERSLEAVHRLDARELETALTDANKSLGTQGALRLVIAPLLQEIGERWRDGSLTAAHEHFASAIVRHSIGMRTRSYVGHKNGPRLIVATPSGQLHELGALLIAAFAANLGWDVVYLGASLTATDIASVAMNTGARAVALSIVYPPDDQELSHELITLRSLLPRKIDIVAGGRAMSSYRAALEHIGAITSNDLSDMGAILDSLREQTIAVL